MEEPAGYLLLAKQAFIFLKFYKKQFLKCSAGLYVDYTCLKQLKLCNFVDYALYYLFTWQHFSTKLISLGHHKILFLLIFGIIKVKIEKNWKLSGKQIMKTRILSNYYVILHYAPIAPMLRNIC